ncbi:MAG: hypothetical protein Q8L79_07740, partial [Methylobacter sp.]|uniref:hypothetical protein n=1 Tax=Methylobacter sp. TaxID=2051955 RepID=UPI002731184E
LDVGRNESARRQQGRMFPAIGAPETPVLRLTRGQAYSGLRRDVYNDESSSLGIQCGKLQLPVSRNYDCMDRYLLLGNCSLRENSEKGRGRK